MNSFPQAKYSGLQVYYSKNDPRSKIIADTVQSAVKVQLQPANTRMPKAAGSSIFLLDRLETPAVLIECGFLSNPQEENNLSQKAYQQKLCAIIAAETAQFLSNT